MQEERFEEFSNLMTGIYWDIQKIKGLGNQLFGMKSVHVFWVYLLRNHPEGLTASELSRFSQSNRSLVSREIDELVQLGYVETRQQGSRRRYGWRFTLTQQGQEAAARISQISVHIQSRVSAGIPLADLETFYRTCRTLLKNFDEITTHISEGLSCL